METTGKNKQVDVSHYINTADIREQPFTFYSFSKSMLCGEVDIVKCVSVHPDWTLNGFNQTFFEFRRFMAERRNFTEKNRMEVNC